MKNTAIKLALSLSLLLLGFSLPVFAQAGPNQVVAIYNTATSSDLCENPSVAKSSVAVNISTSTTTELVPAVAGKSVYFCGWRTTVAGTSPTVQFKTGTKVSTPCDTAPVNLTGTFAVPTGTTFALDIVGVVMFQSTLSGELCVTTGGTTPSVQGVAAYVQR